jgi:starch phosphorylase
MFELPGGPACRTRDALIRSCQLLLARRCHDKLLADYRSYIDCQDRVSAAYSDQESWVRMSILNVARMGKFSSDRSIREYCENIWKVKPLKK